MTFDQRLHEVNLNNLSYLAELCRAHGQEAQVCLHVPPELAEILVGAKPADLARWAACPVAVMQPADILLPLVRANDQASVMAATQAMMTGGRPWDC